MSRRKTKINNSDVLVGFVSPRSPRRGKPLSRVFDNSWRRCVRKKNQRVKKHAKSQWALSNIFVCRKSQPTWIIREFSKFEEKVFQTRVKLLIFTSEEKKPQLRRNNCRLCRRRKRSRKKSVKSIQPTPMIYGPKLIKSVERPLFHAQSKWIEEETSEWVSVFSAISHVKREQWSYLP